MTSTPKRLPGLEEYSPLPEQRRQDAKMHRQKIVELTLAGKNAKQIAEVLGLSHGWVRAIKNEKRVKRKIERGMAELQQTALAVMKANAVEVAEQVVAIAKSGVGDAVQLAAAKHVLELANVRETSDAPVRIGISVASAVQATYGIEIAQRLPADSSDSSDSSDDSEDEHDDDE